MSSRILIIEDNTAFQAAAASVKGLDADLSADYETTMSSLNQRSYDGIISDLFFPRKIGSKDTSLGIKVLDKIVPVTESQAEKMFARFKELKVYDLLDADTKENLSMFADQDRGKLENNPVYRAMVHVADTLGPEIGAQIIKNAYGKEGFARPSKNLARTNRFYRNKLEEAMQKDPSNQPLGILIGEEAKVRGIPLVFATSTYHHDDLTQPLVNYIGARQMGYVHDCPRENPSFKADPKFWSRAYEMLQTAMRSK